MTLYNLIKSILEKVEKQKDNFPREQEVEEKVNYILKHSTMKYNANVFRLESYTAFGVEHWRDVELQLPLFMIFRISYDMKDWVFKSYTDLKHLEFDLSNSEDTIQITLFDGIIKEYNLINDTFNGRVIWNNPIYQIEYKEQGEDRAVLIYDNTQLEEKIKELIADEMENIRIFNTITGYYEHFYIKDIIYSTSENNLPFEFFWGKSEMSFIDLANDEEEYNW